MWPWQWNWSNPDGWIICATILGPILAVQAQKFVERWNEKKRHKNAVFTALMNTRGIRLSLEHVQALNGIGLAFYDAKAVMGAWKGYLDNLGERPAKENEQNHWNKRDDLFRGMLFEMSKHLKYPFSETDIKNTTYRPELHGNVEEAQMQLLSWAADVAAGRKQIPISVIIPQEMVKAQAQQVTFWKDVIEGRASVPVKLESERAVPPIE